MIFFWLNTMEYNFIERFQLCTWLGNIALFSIAIYLEVYCNGELHHMDKFEYQDVQ